MSDWKVTKSDKVATLELSRPRTYNSITFEMYEALSDFFESELSDVNAVVICGANGTFCSGGDRYEIIGPLLKQSAQEQLAFTRLTCRLIKAIKECPIPVVAAITGSAVGAGAVIALAADLRVATKDSQVGFVFPSVGLSGADMGAAYLLQRVVGLGIASEFLLLGKLIAAKRLKEVGFYNFVEESNESCHNKAQRLARMMADGPTFANRVTKAMIEKTSTMSLAEALEAEAVAQAECMQSGEFMKACAGFSEGRGR